MEQTFATKMFELVRDHMKWDDGKTHTWFCTPNPLLGGAEPSDLMERRPEKFERWVTALIEESSAPAALRVEGKEK